MATIDPSTDPSTPVSPAAPTPTLSRYGIPLSANEGRGGMLQPKPKYKFRVRVINFGPIKGGLQLTQQVISVGRPSLSHDAVPVHAYNSTAYYAGKAQWGAISLEVRDDVTNSVSKLVGHQLQKQMNHFEQTSALSGSNYKFQTYLETLDGGNDTIIEQWFLEGCFLTSANYGQFDYSASDPLTISMEIRYDNATQSGGLMPLLPQIGTGNMLG